MPQEVKYILSSTIISVGIRSMPLRAFADIRFLFFLYSIHRIFKADPDYSTRKLFKAFSNILDGEKVVVHDGVYVLSSFLPPVPSKAFIQMIEATAGGNSVFKDNVEARRGAPNTMNVSVTNKCGSECFYCSSPSRDCGRDMDSRTLIKLVGELQDMGVSIIGFTGGEPLLREDLPDIISAVDDRSVTVIYTSGLGLNPEKAGELKSSGLFSVCVSLDHYDRKLFDGRRGFDGAFDVSVSAIENSLQAGLYTVMQSVLSKDTASEGVLWRLLDYARDLGVHELRLMSVCPAGRILREKYGGFLDDSDELSVVEFQRKANKRRGYPKVSSLALSESRSKFGCGAGSNNAYIDSSGNLFACDFLPLSFGSVMEKPVSEIWGGMHEIMRPPRKKCLLRENISEIQRLADGGRPIHVNCGQAPDFLGSRREHGLPGFYRALGGLD